MRRILPLLCLSGSLAAQLAGVAGIDVSDNSGLGYARPTIAALAGVEHITPRWEVSLVGNAGPARKYNFPVGWSAGASLAALAKPWKSLLVGGGAAYQYTISPDWAKDAFRPSVFAGADIGPVRVLYGHTFPGSDRENELDAATLSVRYTIRHRASATRITFHGGHYEFTNHQLTEFSRNAYGITVTQTF